jgi:hypothetical protein
MGRSLALATALVAFASAGCKDKKAEGLPPAQEWSSNTNTLPAAPGAGANPHGGNNPHAGMDMGGGGNNPHAGMDMGGGAPDPHAGVDMSNPHGGAGGSPNVAAMGLPAPDPNRKMDPNHRVTGVIKVHMKAKDRVAPGGAVFVIVKKAGPDGAPVGPPLAVDKLTWTKDELKFSMTDAQSMIAGTELSGDVVVTARYDQDSDAISKQPGDVSGSVRVKVPADNVTLTLDDVLQ